MTPYESKGRVLATLRVSNNPTEAFVLAEYSFQTTHFLYTAIMPIIMAIIKINAICFLPLELEFVQKYEIPYTTEMNIAIGRINFII